MPDGHDGMDIIEHLNHFGHELRVLIYGSLQETEPLFSALERAIGGHETARFDSLPEERAEQRWRFSSHNDAMHASELALHLLEQSGTSLRWFVRMIVAPQEFLSEHDPH